jgi:hypothetical protein
LDPRELTREEIVVTDPELKRLCGGAKFFSITYRCFKLEEEMETLCEDYGQVAYYKVGGGGRSSGLLQGGWW